MKLNERFPRIRAALMITAVLLLAVAAPAAADISAENPWIAETPPGAEVAAGDTVLILESMKMEIPVEAPEAGKITEITVTPEESVEEGQVVCVIESQG